MTLVAAPIVAKDVPAKHSSPAALHRFYHLPLVRRHLVIDLISIEVAAKYLGNTKIRFSPCHVMRTSARHHIATNSSYTTKLLLMLNLQLVCYI